MKAVVASLKRLYTAGKITKDVVRARVAKGTITEEEYKVVTGEDYNAEGAGTSSAGEGQD